MAPGFPQNFRRIFDGRLNVNYVERIFVLAAQIGVEVGSHASSGVMWQIALKSAKVRP